MKRSYKEPAYQEARKRVLKRDKYKCKKCSSREKIQIHHIKQASKFPVLFCVDSNLITLCKKCHESITKSETMYAAMCYALMAKKVD